MVKMKMVEFFRGKGPKICNSLEIKPMLLMAFFG